MTSKPASGGKINVLVVGSGARENALVWKLLQSPFLGSLYVAPGNGGTFDYDVPIKATNVKALVSFAKEHDCFTIVGPEAPLELGLVDLLESEGLDAFGPTREEARLETSKIFAKQFMKANGIPTASFELFSDYERALDYSAAREGNLVVKVDGLAGGKGVFVCSNMIETEKALRSIFIERTFGEAGNHSVLEEKLQGYEVSLMALCDGRSAIPFGTAMDHKRLLDEDKGPNTGGMGAFSPAIDFDSNNLNFVMERIVRPAVQKTGFSGFLYAGLMMTPEGPKVLEFNCRLGDPETQCILPRLKTDLLRCLVECKSQGLSAMRGALPEWENSFSCCVVMCSKGYPGKVETGFPIKGLEDAQKLKDVLVFHGGTTRNIGETTRSLFTTSGGRVLSVNATASTLLGASSKAYEAVRLISWEGENHRTDIGLKRKKDQ